ncbi:thermonuclease family protein [Aeromicrobium sp.]|uniref:thermonuclease family protein n=1 Tax=Aeromicrobium sp. TaxID=1871063 RepID=UPI004033D975
MSSAPSRARRLVWVVGILALVWLAVSELGMTSDDGGTAKPPTTSTSTTERLTVTDLKDGDSFEASDGREYRLGMLNTPEPDERCFDEAEAFTRDFLAGGFTADAYDEDDYGRVVAEVLDGEGRSLNVALARSGLADDRYLDPFRGDHPDLANRLDDAFASAKKPACR